MRKRLPLRLLPWLCLLLPSFALGQENQARRLEGLWVEGAVLRALDVGERRELGCFLRIEATPLQVIGTCGREVLEWPVPALLPSGQATIQVRSGYRSLVLRTGTPNELEVQGADGMHRLYRVPREQIPLLLRWAWAERRLVGTWRSEDGASLELRADGTFAFEQEGGSYEVRDDVVSDGGAWGMITMKGERERRYLLHGDGERLGLAELSPNLEFELFPERVERDEVAFEPEAEAHAPTPRRRRPDLEGPARVPQGPEGRRADEEVASAVLSRGGWGFGVDATVTATPPPEDEGQRPEDALPSWLQGAGAAEEVPGSRTERGDNLPTVQAGELRSRIVFVTGEREPEVTLWFERGQVVEEAGAPGEEEEVAEVEEASPPASEPILPPSRICGCQSGQGTWAWLAFVPLLVSGFRRRMKGAD